MTVKAMDFSFSCFGSLLPDFFLFFQNYEENATFAQKLK
jgi:hypothetical protein